MHERLVICGGLPTPQRRGLKLLELDAAPDALNARRVELRLETVSAKMVDNLPDVLVDALEIAAHVFAADQLTTRGSPQMTRMGSEWRRNFRFMILGRRLEIWKSAGILEALTEALSFLTEDAFDFQFAQGDRPVGVSPYLGFSDPNAQTVAPDEVVLFSGGLDSLAGAMELLSTKSIAMVSHQSSTLVTSTQNSLAESLKTRMLGRQIFYAPVTVRRGERQAVEFTQRSRSFLFSTLGMLVAEMFGRDRVNLFENGVVSFNLPIAEHVLGARPAERPIPAPSALSHNFSLSSFRGILKFVIRTFG
jgi:hypothetical protein